MTRIVAVTSGKAGAGKTHVSVNLALQWARNGQRVCLLDVDSGKANAMRLLDVEPQLTLDDLVEGRCLLRDIVIFRQGIDIIPHGGIAYELPTCTVVRLAQELSTLASYDLILLDAGPFASNLSFVAAAAEVLLVLTPESTALTEAYALVKQLQRRQYAGQISVIMNQAQSQSQAQHAYEKFREVVRVYQGIGLTLLGSLLYDKQIAEAGEQRRPIFLHAATSSAALALTELTNRFVRTPPPSVPHVSVLDFWAQMLGGELPADAALQATIPGDREGDVTALPEHYHEQATEPVLSTWDLDTRLERLEAKVAMLQQGLQKSPDQPCKPSIQDTPTSVEHATAMPPPDESRSNTDAEATICSIRTVQRSTPINALQLRRVVGRMLMKATSANAATDTVPVQISVDQMQIETGNDFSLQPGRYTRISLHCQHIEKPDSFIEEIFSACAISGCKVRHLGSHVRYWVTSGRDGCILLDGDDMDSNCVQVYMAASGNNNASDIDGFTPDVVPRLRRVADTAWPADAAPLKILGKYPHQRLLIEQDEGETHEIYRVLRRDRSPLLCAFHGADGEIAASEFRDSHHDSRGI